MLRLADLLAGLSRVADLGFGLQPGESLRASALALLMGARLDLSDEDRRAAMYSALLLHLGCIGYAHETAEVFGDDLAMNAAVARTNVEDAKDVLTTFVPALAAGGPGGRIRAAILAFTRGRRFGLAYETAACEVGRDAARRLHLPQEIERTVYHNFERWNGGGVPAALQGDAIPVGSRLAMLATVATIFDTHGGVGTAADAVRRQSGTTLDPEFARRFTDDAEELLGEINARDPRQLVVDGEPDAAITVPDRRLVEVASVFGAIADLKTPHTHGHAQGVARLVRHAGSWLGFSPDELHSLEVAALLHDVGRVGVPNTVWEKRGPLSTHEWEQVRLHPYHAERVLSGSERLASLASLVGMHHERLDGSGYHRGCRGADQPMPARVLAAADAYHAMRQPRPHRAALSAPQAEHCLLDGARAGIFDPDAVNGVLAAAGHEATASRVRPAGLTDREVEVLGLVAEGCTNAEIARRLVISKRTAEHHVQHIYTKIGVSSRAAVALFAMDHDLLPQGTER